MHTPEQLFVKLDALDIAYRTVTHPPVFTVEQAKALRGELPGAHIKNLFLRNKKEEMWLVVALEDRVFDVKQLGEKLGAGRLSFGSPDRLRRTLGVEPGSVTPLSLVNDTSGEVRVALDRGLQAGIVNVHPLTNTMTTAISAPDLMKFFAMTGHVPLWLDFPL